MQIALSEVRPRDKTSEIRPCVPTPQIPIKQFVRVSTLLSNEKSKRQGSDVEEWNGINA
jgi:hypothetical protein